MFVSPLLLSCAVSEQRVEQELPEGTDAGLKGANSSVGGCRPSEGSRVLAGEAGVCAGCEGGKHEWEYRSQEAHEYLCVYERELLTDGEVMSGGVDMSPKISNWFRF